MNGKNHERLLMGLLPGITYYLGTIHADPKLSLLFYVLYLVGTFLFTCDNDTHSRSTKRLWILGWIINKLFKHRGVLHSVWLWAFIGAAGYYYIGWAWCGLIVPQGVHILSDKVF